MKKTIQLFSILIGLQLFVNLSVTAQDFLAFSHDNYGGATSMFYQPASIADSRYKFDMEFIGFSTRIENNWWGMDRQILFDFNSWNQSGFADKYLIDLGNDESKNVFQSVEVRTMSFMTTLSPKSAFGFSVRGRQMLNFNNLHPDAADLILNRNDVPALNFTQLDFSDMSQQAVAWAEYGLTYSRVLYDNKKNFLKAGVTGKLLQGMGAMYLWEKQMAYQMISPDVAVNVDGDFRFGASSNFEDIFDFSFVAKPSIGGDIGVVYEYRPKYKEYKYDMDGQKGLDRRDQNKYLFKVGLSVLDVGSMKFKKEFGSNDFRINQDTLAFNILDIKTLSDLADSISGNISSTDPNFKFRLPTTINLDVDFRVMNGLYINVAGRLALNQGYDYIAKAHYINSLSMTPRYELKWFGISIPMRFNQYEQFSMGLGLRMGPVWIGSNNLLAITGLQETITSADVYLAIKIPIMYKAPVDTDEDKVSDKIDECPTVKGPYEFKGCPDSDGDGIPNKIDDCAYTAGLPEFNGCPDSDGDGVQDKFDECPEIPGSKLFAGCPDSDEDGVIDKNDSCPSLAGLTQFAGCPDTDGDSLPDNMDDCPTVAGLVTFAGCPDTDGDGITDAMDLCPNEIGPDSLQGCPFVDTDADGLQDKDDQCPKVAGPIENRGCPYADTDNDSVPDVDDLCPMTPGTVANNGCPEIEEEEQEILNTAFNNLEFETGKATILTSSLKALDELAALMNKKTSFRLLIEGHTDNVGKPNSNMSLSQQRALAVKTYLSSQNVNSSRIDAKWYGETKPIADNSTKEGRTKNRRVEMEIIFD